MKKEMYICDGGCVAVVCGETTISIPNRYGDGCFKVYEMDRSEYKEYKAHHEEKYGIEEKEYVLVCYINSNCAKVMEYDCWNENTKVLFELSGKYSVYANYGKVYFINEKGR